MVIFLFPAIDSCTVHESSNKSKLGYIVHSSGICGDHGTCTTLPENKYKCDCELGWEGTHCELSKLLCKFNKDFIENIPAKTSENSLIPRIDVLALGAIVNDFVIQLRILVQIMFLKIIFAKFIVLL